MVDKEKKEDFPFLTANIEKAAVEWCARCGGATITMFMGQNYEPIMCKCHLSPGDLKVTVRRKES